MRNKKICVAIFALIIILPEVLFAVYPTTPMTGLLVTGTFMEMRSNHFHTGIDCIGSNDGVYAVEDGNLYYQGFHLLQIN